MLIKYEDYKGIPNDKVASYEAILGENFDDLKISQVLPDFTYCVFRALTANVPNMNADQFDTDELLRFDDRQSKQVYQTFNGRSIFTNHKSDKVENSIGVIFDSYFNQADLDDQFVEIVFGIDKEKAGDIARGIETGRLKSGSMGCSITHSICTICDSEVRTEADFCSHLKFHRNQLMEDGRRVAEKLRGVNFQEYSIVTAGADPKANLRYLVSSVIDYKRLPKAAAEADIFGLMRIIVQEVKTASLEDKFRIAKNLTTVLSNIEGAKFTFLNDAGSHDLNQVIDMKLSALFNYAKKAYTSDLPGFISRPNGINLKDFIGKEVEVTPSGNIYLLS